MRAFIRFCAAGTAVAVLGLAAMPFLLAGMVAANFRWTSAASQATGALPEPGGQTNPVRQFARLLLERLGAPVTTANLDAIDAWAAGEGSCASFNPLDTTQPEPGATPFNTLPGGSHVWNYPSLDTGVRATAETLLNGLYRPVLAALMVSGGLDAVAAAVLHSPWGTGAFGSPAFAGRPCGPSPGGS